MRYETGELSHHAGLDGDSDSTAFLLGQFRQIVKEEIALTGVQASSHDAQQPSSVLVDDELFDMWDIEEDE